MMATPLVSVYYTKFSFNSVINHYHIAYHFHPTTMLVVKATTETELSSLFENGLCSAARATIEIQVSAPFNRRGVWCSIFVRNVCTKQLYKSFA